MQMKRFYLNFLSQITARDFILVAPNGIKMPEGKVVGGKDYSNQQFWHANDACCDFANTDVNDIGYSKQLLQHVFANYSVDLGQVYLFGHSNGGFMASTMTCEIADQVTAVANLA
jgi:poly(3-hydroxybutyrate) depolymerase